MSPEAQGKLLWFISHDVHDDDLSQVSRRFNTMIDGAKRYVISVGGKYGLLRLLDRSSQKQFYEVPITTRDNFAASDIHLVASLAKVSLSLGNAESSASCTQARA
jgi:hypothetical protein